MFISDVVPDEVFAAEESYNVNALVDLLYFADNDDFYELL